MKLYNMKEDMIGSVIRRLFDHQISSIEYLKEQDRAVVHMEEGPGDSKLVAISLSTFDKEEMAFQGRLLRIEDGIYLNTNTGVPDNINLVDARKTPIRLLRILSNDLKNALYQNHLYSIDIHDIGLYSPEELKEKKIHLIAIDVGKKERLFSAISLQEDTMFQMYPFVHRLSDDKTYLLENETHLLSFSEFMNRLAKSDLAKELDAACDEEEQELTLQQERGKEHFIQKVLENPQF